MKVKQLAAKLLGVMQPLCKKSNKVIRDLLLDGSIVVAITGTHTKGEVEPHSDGASENKQHGLPSHVEQLSPGTVFCIWA